MPLNAIESPRLNDNKYGSRVTWVPVPSDDPELISKVRGLVKNESIDS